MKRLFSALPALMVSIAAGVYSFSVHAQIAIDAIESSHVVDLASTPEEDVHQKVIDAISRSQKSVKMWMFSWTDVKVAQALIDAHNRGVQTQVLLDPSNFRGKASDSGSKSGAPSASGDSSTSGGLSGSDEARNMSVVEILQQAGVEVIEASRSFSLTHAKTLLIDDRLSIVMTMNLTKIASKVRDTAVFLDDATLAQDLKNLFAADLENAKTSGQVTPNLQSSALIVSPVNSTTQLLNLIQKAQKEILLTTENFGSDEVFQGLVAALKRGVKISMITPLCNMSSEHFYSIPHLQSLAQAGASVKVMSYPASIQTPYIHQKMAIVDQSYVFVGSENLSFNSLEKAREIGVNFQFPKNRVNLIELFQKDWQSAQDIPKALPASCSAL